MTRPLLLIGLLLGAGCTAPSSEPANASATPPALKVAGAQAAVRNAGPDPWVEPQDTTDATNNPSRYAWRLFVALNWPADVAKREADPARRLGENATTVWEAWKLSSGPNDQVFLNRGADPGEWLTPAPVRSLGDFEPLPLQQQIRQRRRIGLRFDPATAARQINENHLNQAAYVFIRSKELYNIDGQEKIYGLTAIHMTTKDLPNWFWATFEHVDNPKRQNNEPWLLPSEDKAAGPKGYPEDMGIQGTFWENYRLRGVQTEFVDASGKATRLANSQIEEGFQLSSSCITCHARATIGPRMGSGANRLSIFLDQFPNANPVGPVGVSDNGLFEKKTFSDIVIGERLYLQADFVWSLMRAKRKS